MISANGRTICTAEPAKLALYKIRHMIALYSAVKDLSKFNLLYFIFIESWNNCSVDNAVV